VCVCVYFRVVFNFPFGLSFYLYFPSVPVFTSGCLNAELKVSSVYEPGDRLYQKSRFKCSLRKADWIGHILRRNCLLQQVTEGKIKGG
jgi:hypothetical protein